MAMFSMRYIHGHVMVYDKNGKFLTTLYLGKTLDIADMLVHEIFTVYVITMIFWTCLLVFIFVEKLIHFEWFPTGVVASVICATELWSISGNILIVNPNIPFFNIIRPALKGEIARKLNISEDDVDDALNGLIDKK